MALFPEIKRFLVENFWLPLVDESVYYNPFNTVVYAIGFAAAAVYIGRPMLDKLNIKVDKQFALGLSPFIILGGAVRVLEDRAIVDTIFLKTPFIYLLMFGVVASLLGISKLLEKKLDIEYHKTLIASGSIGLIILLGYYATILNALALEALLTVVFIQIVLILLVHTGTSYFKQSLAVPAFEIPILAHYWDAATSYTALTLSSASEEHVLAGAFIDAIGPSGIFVAKTLIIVPAVYFIYDGFEGEERNYYLLLVTLLGIALGTRNILSLITG